MVVDHFRLFVKHLACDADMHLHPNATCLLVCESSCIWSREASLDADDDDDEHDADADGDEDEVNGTVCHVLGTLKSDPAECTTRLNKGLLPKGPDIYNHIMSSERTRLSRPFFDTYITPASGY